MVNSHAEGKSIVVEPGKVLDFIDGVTQRNETPEEYVRQEILKSLIREYGYSKTNVAVEVPIRMGSRRPRADVVVFADGTLHRQDNAVIIVECKAPKIAAASKRDGVGQLKSYMAACPNVSFGMWTNGTDRFCYRRVEELGTIQFEEVLDLPRWGAEGDEAERPDFDDLNPATSDALLFAFRRCHNYIAGNQGLQKPEAFWELLKLIFCKIHDERTSTQIQFYIPVSERHGVNGPLKAKDRIEKLFSKVKAEFPTIFSPGESIELNPRVLAYTVAQLQNYLLLESDVDVKGRAYEEVVGSNLRGDRGEFFTPRNVCRMAVEMLDPSDTDLVLDPACGTGGFLITAMNHVIAKITSQEQAKWRDPSRALTSSRDRVSRFARRNIVGIDLNPNLVKAAKMNMVMNNDGSGGLYQGNSLVAPVLWDDDLRGRGLIGSVDVLLTNPPFGSKIRIDDPSILERYDLAHSWKYDEDADRWSMGDNIQKSQPPEILFIERCVQFLKPGTGRAAIVLPDGILGSPGLGYVRQWILAHTRVLASIDLHPDTFQPSTSVQTSLLVVQRMTEEETERELAGLELEPYEVFMAVADHVGHDKRGNTTYVRDAQGNEIIAEIHELATEYEGGVLVRRPQTMMRKVVDDNTAAIATAFREWLLRSADG